VKNPYRRGGRKFVGAVARRDCLVQHRGMTKQCFEFGRYVTSVVSEIGRDLLVARWCGMVVSKPHGDA
jgi:hypothetical protein